MKAKKKAQKSRSMSSTLTMAEYDTDHFAANRPSNSNAPCDGILKQIEIYRSLKKAGR